MENNESRGCLNNYYRVYMTAVRPKSYGAEFDIDFVGPLELTHCAIREKF